MKPYIYLLVVFLFVGFAANSQTKISGRVVNSKDIPLPFVSVMLLRNTTFILGTTTDKNGDFQVVNNFQNDSSYSLEFSLVGFEQVRKEFIYPDTIIGRRIVLPEKKDILKEVIVTAKKPFVIRKTDRYIVNVENSLLANGNNGIEVLQKSPGIWVDNSGRIRMKGNQSVNVMINDVMLKMSEEDLAEYLKTLKSEDISKIEVIQNPPAEFDAAGTGGIIHIILKKAQKSGFRGSAYARYMQQGKTPLIGLGSSMDYKTKNLYFAGSYSYTIDKLHSFAKTDIIYPDQSLYKNFTNRFNDNLRNGYRLAMIYDLSKNHTISAQVLGNSSKLDQSFNTDISFIKNSGTTTGQANSQWLKIPNLTSSTLNYTLKIDSAGTTFKVIADFTKGTKEESNSFYPVYSDTSGNSNYRNSAPNSTDIYSVQADYDGGLKKNMEVKTGIKFSSIRRDNNLIREDNKNNVWVFNAPGSNHFIYKEKILMLYYTIEKNFEKTDLKIGVRGEETFLQGNSLTSNEQFAKNYFGLFPSLFITRKIQESKGHSLYFNYSRRLQRPAFNELNPYRLQFDNFTFQKGNPDLLPEYSHKVEAGCFLFNDYSADIYFQTSKNTIAMLANPKDSNVIEYQYKNFDNSIQYGFDLNIPLTIVKSWRSSNSFNVYNLAYGLGTFNIKQTTFYGKTIQSITIKKLFDFDLISDYRSPYVYANSKIPSMFTFDVSVAKKILHNNGRIRVYCSDLFNTLRDIEITDYNNTHIDFYQKRPTRTISLSFSYNFSSGKKFNNKKVEQNNAEEKDRVGN